MEVWDVLIGGAGGGGGTFMDFFDYSKTKIPWFEDGWTPVDTRTTGWLTTSLITGTCLKIFFRWGSMIIWLGGGGGGGGTIFLTEWVGTDLKLTIDWGGVGL